MMTAGKEDPRRHRIVVGRNMGKVETVIGSKEERITLKNYLDMSREEGVSREAGKYQASSSSNTLNLRRHHQDGSKNAVPWQQQQRLDLSKSLNGESGSIGSRGRIDLSRSLNSEIGFAQRRQKRNDRSLGPSHEPHWNPAAAEALRRNKITHVAHNVLPTSPNLTDSPQEKQLVAAFVDQLNILASSSECARRRPSGGGKHHHNLVRRALAFPDMSKPDMSTVTFSESSRTAAATRRSKLMPIEEEKKPRVRSNAAGAQRRRQSDDVEEKQTVISSPICHAMVPSSSLRETTAAMRVRMKAVDMAIPMQEHAIMCTSQLLDSMDKLNAKLIASLLKKEFDKLHGPAWHCIVGTSFGSYVTHSVGGFIYFAMGKVSILLFRTAIQVISR